MRSPRGWLTIRRMMIGMALIGLNIAAIPWLVEVLGGYYSMTSLGVVEMAAILALPMPGLALRIARTGQVGGLSLGFEVFGWASVLALLAGMVFAPDRLAAYSDAVIFPTWLALGPARTIVPDASSGEPMVSIEVADRSSQLLMALAWVFVFTLPQVALAALGGWLFRWRRIMLVIGGGDRGPEEAEARGDSTDPE